MDCCWIVLSSIGYHAARRWYCREHGESVELASIKSSPSLATVLTNRGVKVSISTVVASRQMRQGDLQKGKSVKSQDAKGVPSSLRHQPDVLVHNEGTIFLFDPLTAKAKEWIEEHVQDDAQWFGTTLVVEHRYAWGLAQGLQDAGLVLE